MRMEKNPQCGDDCKCKCENHNLIQRDGIIIFMLRNENNLIFLSFFYFFSSTIIVAIITGCPHRYLIF